MTSAESHVDEVHVPGEGKNHGENIDVSDLSAKPCSLHSVVIEGNEKTDSKVIERYLEKAKKAQTLGDLTEALQNAREELLELGIFDLVDIVIDAGPVENPNSATAYVSVEENSGYSLSAGTYLQGHEPTVQARGGIKNKLGQAESIKGHLSWGKESSAVFGLELNLPHVFKTRRGQLQKHVYQSWNHWTRFSSHSQSLRGITITYKEGNHDLVYDFTWRNNKVQDTASPAVRRMLGHSLLSSLSYCYSLNRLNSNLRPTEGYALNLTTQLAGLGPGGNFVRFIKQQVEGSVAFPLPVLNAAVTSSVHAGVLLPWSSNGRPPMINDKFFLGGANPLRGFRSQGVGPASPRSGSTGNDRVGGDLLFSATAGLSFDLPSALLSAWGLHGHGFACAGNLLPLSAVSASLSSPSQLASDFLTTMRCSAGLGVVSCSRLGRVEFNYCWVLRKQETDRIAKHGFQVCWNGPSP